MFRYNARLVKCLLFIISVSLFVWNSVIYLHSETQKVVRPVAIGNMGKLQDLTSDEIDFLSHVNERLQHAPESEHDLEFPSEISTQSSPRTVTSHQQHLPQPPSLLEDSQEQQPDHFIKFRTEILTQSSFHRTIQTNEQEESNRSMEHHSVMYQTSEQVFRARREQIAAVCQRQDVPGRVHGVFSHPSGALYCFVPKAGCTFWKRVFRAAIGKRNITKEDIFSITRNEIHGIGGKGAPYTERFKSSHYPTRFIVARDPFSRLLSSYLDKIYLPDFWPTEVVPMVRYRLKELIVKSKSERAEPYIPEWDFLLEHFNTMAALFDDGSPRANMSVQMEGRYKCGKYMTFAEFVKAGFNREEPHWMPIHKICNPCYFNVTYLSRMETFTEDARFLLDKMGIHDILDDVDEDVHVDEELKTIVEYNYNHVYHNAWHEFYQSCVSYKELAYRLWHNFQWRGYIDPEVKYNVPDFSTEQEVKEDLMAQIWNARKSGLENRGRMKAAKKYFKAQAYATITKHMFEKLSKKYELDFKLFGYEEIRDKLYSQYY